MNIVKAALLCALLASASAAPLLSAPTTSQFGALVAEGRVGETPCEFCSSAVVGFEQYLADADTQRLIVDYIDQNVCAALPAGEPQQLCEQEAPVLLASATSALTQALAPRDLCAVLGVCPSAALLAERFTVAGPLDCPVCKMVIITLVQRLEDPSGRQEIEQSVREACDSLPADAGAQCQGDVSQFFEALDRLLRDVDPEGVCEVARFCDRDGTAVRLAAPQGLVQLRALSSQMARIPSASNDMCDSCKTIVTEASAILQDPKTQLEIMEYAKEGCAVFEDFKDQCVQYVELYGPLVFNMILGYLQPEMLCMRLGYCTAAAQA